MGGTSTRKQLDSIADEKIIAVNVFVTAQEEPGLGGNLYLEPDSRLYMAEYASLLQATARQ